MEQCVVGGQPCHLVNGSLVREMYGSETIIERHRHRYEVNNLLLKRIEDAGLKIAGRSVDNKLVEIIENPNHPWFVACQFHPEFTSHQEMVIRCLQVLLKPLVSTRKVS